MQYAILAHESSDDFAQRNDPETAEEYWASWAGYVAALQESGIMSAAAGLQPPGTATTLRLRGGTTEVQDGPFADVKEASAGSLDIAIGLTGDPAVRSYLVAQRLRRVTTG